MSRILKAVADFRLKNHFYEMKFHLIAIFYAKIKHIVSND